MRTAAVPDGVRVHYMLTQAPLTQRLIIALIALAGGVPSCSSDSEVDSGRPYCGNGERCPAQHYCSCLIDCFCYPGCTSDADCETHSFCATSFLGARQCEPGCRADSECASGEFCRSGECVPYCTRQSDCSEDALCVRTVDNWFEAATLLAVACSSPDAGIGSTCTANARCMCASCDGSRASTDAGSLWSSDAGISAHEDSAYGADAHGD